MNKKCVIIGSGLGGLACGCILAKNGYEVTVLEQDAQIGGCLQCFSRGKVVFDTGMHYIGSAEPGQTLYAVMHYLGLDQHVKLTRLDSAGYDVISFQGKHYSLANGKENFVDMLAKLFPESREELSNYLDLIKRVVSASAMHSLNEEVDLNVHAEYQVRSVNEVIDSVITNPTLREVLAGIVPLYAGVKDHTPFVTHALIFDCYHQSAFRIVGGSSKVADSLAVSLRENGGEVLVNHQVSRIECDDTQATAVVTSDGERFLADLVISDIHPVSTMNLIESHLIRNVYRKRIEGLQNTTGAFTVYLKFRKNRVKYMNKNIYYYRSDSVWGCEQYDAESWPKFLLYMHICHDEQAEYAEAGEILTYMNFSEVEPWLGTKVGHRGEDYEAMKRMKAEKLIDALEEEIPGIRDDIETYYTSTPLTYQDYTGIPEGSMYGLAKDVTDMGAGSVSCRTRIPNLLLTGQSITCHGMMGVLAGSLVTCSEVIKRNELFAQIKQAN